MDYNRAARVKDLFIDDAIAVEMRQGHLVAGLKAADFVTVQTGGELRTVVSVVDKAVGGDSLSRGVVRMRWQGVAIVEGFGY